MRPSSVITAACILIVGAAIVASCGGQLYGNPAGYVDDAGAFHAPDGAVVFGPGSACAGYDSSTFANVLTRSCSNDGDCTKWLAATTPPNYATAPSCANRLCGANFAVSFSVDPRRDNGPIYCTQGEVGDAYCAAFFQQFLLGDAHVSATCQHECQMVSPENAPPYCASGSDYYACVTGTIGTNCSCADTPLANLELCVYRGSAPLAQCEAPCTPPPNAASDGGGG